MPSLDHLRLRSLSLIEAVAETGSLHQAARRLNVSQPALTVMLQEVERTLGGQLFERSRRGLTPTERGLYAIRQARLVLADLRRVQSEFAAGQHGLSLLRVGVLQVLMLELVPRALARLRRENPALRIEFQEGAVGDLLKALSDGTLDLVLGRMPPEFVSNDDLQASLLFTDSYCVIASADHPLARKRRVAWPELQSLSWIEPPANTMLRDFFVDTFLRHGLKPPQPLYQSASFYSCVNILERSDCLMLVPREVGRHFSHRAGICILPVAVEGPDAAFSIVKRRSRADTTGMRAFEACLRQSIGRRAR